ncbi:MAG: class 1 fructose-bisphosphatase [Thermoprotei archaeon]
MYASDYVRGISAKLAAIFSEFERAVVSLLEEIPEARGMSGGTNIYGEKQKKLDVVANDLFIKCLESTGVVSQVATEELDEPLKLEGSGLAVVMDPLDGSSNVETNNLMGTIVGVYKELNFPLKPVAQVCAFYTVYGPSTTMVFAGGGRVAEFVLAKKGESKNRFIVVGDNLRIHERGEVYGVGGLRSKWPPHVKKLVEELESQGYKLRYGGSFVGDFNQVLHYGGLFSYPSTTDSPNGKLRALYEAGPISFIAEMAGGYATDGKQSILQKTLVEHGERTPLYVGSKIVCKRVEELVGSV